MVNRNHLQINIRENSAIDYLANIYHQSVLSEAWLVCLNSPWFTLTASQIPNYYYVANCQMLFSEADNLLQPGVGLSQQLSSRARAVKGLFISLTVFALLFIMSFASLKIIELEELETKPISWNGLKCSFPSLWRCCIEGQFKMR